jgi:serine protease
VITVASVNRNGGRAWYSNFGAVVDVAAPGGDTTITANGVLSTLNTGTTTPGSDNYEFYQGTSMATPHVAGVVALMLARNGALTPDEVETRLRNSTRAFPASCSQCGTGIVDALAAVNAATGGGGGGGSELQNGVAVSNLSGATGAELRYTMNVPAGATNLQFQISGGTGDADLYVRFGSAPTTSTFDCRPYLNGNNETCTIASPQTGTYHVMIRGYSSFSGLTLRGSYSTGGSGCAAGFTSYTGSLSSGGSAYLPTSAGFSAIAGLHSGRLTGPAAADFDLFLQRRSGSSWVVAARSEGSTSTESIDYNGAANTYRWRVLAYSGSGSYRLCVKRP